MSYIAWLVVFVVFAALELVSLGLTCIWFAIGALAGFGILQLLQQVGKYILLLKDDLLWVI